MVLDDGSWNGLISEIREGHGIMAMWRSPLYAFSVRWESSCLKLSLIRKKFVNSLET